MGKVVIDAIIAFIAIVLLAILVVSAVALCCSIVNGLMFGQQLAEWFGAETFFVKWFLK